MGTKNSLRRIAQILWGGWELYGLITWIGGGVVSNFVLFLFSPFVREIPFLLKMLYGIGLFVAFLILSVLIIRLLQALFKTREESKLSQIISGSPREQQASHAGRDIIQVSGNLVLQEKLGKKAPILLQNRDALIKAIWEVKKAVVNVVVYRERSDKMSKQDSERIHWGAIEEMRKADDHCQLCLENLDKELLVAGQDFKQCASNLTTFVYTQLHFRQKGIASSLVLNAVEFTARLVELVDKTIQKIDEVSGQVPRKEETASQMHDQTMGKHRTRIVELLNTWKEQLSLMIKSDKLDEIVAIIENDEEFRAILDHCPSVKGKYNSLGIQRVQFKMHLNPKALVKGEVIPHKATEKEIAKNKKFLDEKMRVVIKAIERCLKSNEYTQTKCDWCPKDMR